MSEQKFIDQMTENSVRKALANRLRDGIAAWKALGKPADEIRAQAEIVAARWRDRYGSPDKAWCDSLLDTLLRGG